MTTAINTQYDCTTQCTLNKSPTPKQEDRKVLSFLSGQFKTGGLFGDGVNALKLMNFWTESLTGARTVYSAKMTEAGQSMKRYMGALSFPDKVLNLGDCYKGLSKGTAQSVAEFGESITGLGKSVLDGVELANKSFGLLSEKTIQVLKPLDHFGPASALAIGAKEATFKNVPAIRENWGVSTGKVSLNMMKLAKNVALVGVGVLSMVAAFFRPIMGLWAIPTLLTISLVSSVSARFFEGLVLAPKSKPI